MASESGVGHDGLAIPTGLFFGIPFFEVASFTSLGETLPEALASGALVSISVWFLVLRPPLTDATSGRDPLEALFACRALRVLARFCVVVCAFLALHLIFSGWHGFLWNWIRRTETLVAPELLRLMPASAVVLTVSGAFVLWSLYRALGSPTRRESAVMLFGGVAALILVRALLVFHDVLPAMWTGFARWRIASLHGLSFPWLYLTAVALAARLIPLGARVGRLRALTLALGVAAACAVSNMIPNAWLIRLKRDGGGLTGGPVGMIRAGWAGDGSLRSQYDGSEWLLILAGLGTVITLLYILRLGMHGRFASIGVVGLAALGWIGWPSFLDNCAPFALFAGVIASSALLGVGVGQGLVKAPGHAWHECLAAATGLACGIWAWLSSTLFFGFVPFAVSVGAAGTLASWRRWRTYSDIGRLP